MRSNFHLMGAPTAVLYRARCSLAAPAGRAAAHAAVATAVADHDGAAGGATGCVAHLVHLAHGVGGVVDAAISQVRHRAGSHWIVFRLCAVIGETGLGSAADRSDRIA